MSDDTEPNLTNFNFRCDPKDKADFIANAKACGWEHQKILRRLIASANELFRQNKTPGWPLTVVDRSQQPLDAAAPISPKHLDDAITRVILGDEVLPALASAVAQAMVMAKQRRPRRGKTSRASRTSGYAS